ncbi:unnamed protein product, partial [Cyprideis torosa]
MATGDGCAIRTWETYLISSDGTGITVKGQEHQHGGCRLEECRRRGSAPTDGLVPRRANPESNPRLVACFAGFAGVCFKPSQALKGIPQTRPHLVVTTEWQTCSDFNEKREIRKHMNRIREQRLAAFYSNDDEGNDSDSPMTTSGDSRSEFRMSVKSVTQPITGAGIEVRMDKEGRTDSVTARNVRLGALTMRTGRQEEFEGLDSSTGLIDTSGDQEKVVIVDTGKKGDETVVSITKSTYYTTKERLAGESFASMKNREIADSTSPTLSKRKLFSKGAIDYQEESLSEDEKPALMTTSTTTSTRKISTDSRSSKSGVESSTASSRRKTSNSGIPTATGARKSSGARKGSIGSPGSSDSERRRSPPTTGERKTSVSKKSSTSSAIARKKLDEGKADTVEKTTEYRTGKSGIAKLSTVSTYSVGHGGSTVTTTSSTTRNIASDGTGAEPHVQTWTKETVTETSSTSPETIIHSRTIKTGSAMASVVTSDNVARSPSLGSYINTLAKTEDEQEGGQQETFITELISSGVESPAPASSSPPPKASASDDTGSDTSSRRSSVDRTRKSSSPHHGKRASFSRSIKPDVRPTEMDIISYWNAYKVSVEDLTQMYFRQEVTVEEIILLITRKYIIIEEIESIEILEQMLEVIQDFDTRRQIRAQIRVLRKRSLAESSLTTESSYRASSSVRSRRDEKTSDSKAHDVDLIPTKEEPSRVEQEEVVMEKVEQKPLDKAPKKSEVEKPTASLLTGMAYLGAFSEKLVTKNDEEEVKKDLAPGEDEEDRGIVPVKDETVLEPSTPKYGQITVEIPIPVDDDEVPDKPDEEAPKTTREDVSVLKPAVVETPVGESAQEFTFKLDEKRVIEESVDKPEKDFSPKRKSTEDLVRQTKQRDEPNEGKFSPFSSPSLRRKPVSSYPMDDEDGDFLPRSPTTTSRCPEAVEEPLPKTSTPVKKEEKLPTQRRSELELENEDETETTAVTSTSWEFKLSPVEDKPSPDFPKVEDQKKLKPSEETTVASLKKKSDSYKRQWPEEEPLKSVDLLRHPAESHRPERRSVEDLKSPSLVRDDHHRPTSDKPTTDKPAERRPTSDKPAERSDKPAERRPTSDKPAERSDKPAERLSDVPAERELVSDSPVVERQPKTGREPARTGSFKSSTLNSIKSKFEVVQKEVDNTGCALHGGSPKPVPTIISSLIGKFESSRHSSGDTSPCDSPPTTRKAKDQKTTKPRDASPKGSPSRRKSEHKRPDAPKTDQTQEPTPYARPEGMDIVTFWEAYEVNTEDIVRMWTVKKVTVEEMVTLLVYKKILIQRIHDISLLEHMVDRVKDYDDRLAIRNRIREMKKKPADKATDKKTPEKPQQQVTARQTSQSPTRDSQSPVVYNREVQLLKEKYFDSVQPLYDAERRRSDAKQIDKQLPLTLAESVDCEYLEEFDMPSTEEDQFRGIHNKSSRQPQTKRPSPSPTRKPQLRPEEEELIQVWTSRKLDANDAVAFYLSKEIKVEEILILIVHKLITIEEIFSVEILEELLKIVKEYDIRSRLRVQIRHLQKEGIVTMLDDGTTDFSQLQTVSPEEAKTKSPRAASTSPQRPRGKVDTSRFEKAPQPEPEEPSPKKQPTTAPKKIDISIFERPSVFEARRKEEQPEQKTLAKEPVKQKPDELKLGSPARETTPKSPTPKSPTRETPKSPTRETPKSPTRETPKSPTRETPKVASPTRETPTTRETPKSKTPTRDTPKVASPTRETPKVASAPRETPKTASPMRETTKMASPMREKVEPLKKTSPVRERPVQEKPQKEKPVSPDVDKPVWKTDDVRKPKEEKPTSDVTTKPKKDILLSDIAPALLELDLVPTPGPKPSEEPKKPSETSATARSKQYTQYMDEVKNTSFDELSELLNIPELKQKRVPEAPQPATTKEGPEPVQEEELLPSAPPEEKPTEELKKPKKSPSKPATSPAKSSTKPRQPKEKSPVKAKTSSPKSTERKRPTSKSPTKAPRKEPAPTSSTTSPTTRRSRDTTKKPKIPKEDLGTTRPFSPLRDTNDRNYSPSRVWERALRHPCCQGGEMSEACHHPHHPVTKGRPESPARPPRQRPDEKPCTRTHKTTPATSDKGDSPTKHSPSHRPSWDSQGDTTADEEEGRRRPRRSPVQ